MRFENCIYDNLQLADRFLKMSELLMRSVGTRGEDEASVLDLHALMEYFGFHSFIAQLHWQAKNYGIWGDDNGDFIYASANGFPIGVQVWDSHVLALANHYAGVAKRLMEIKE